MTKPLLLGKIVAAHGIRGFVKVLVYAEDPYLLEHEKLSPFPITMKNSAGKYWLAEVDGVKDRNAAEALRGTELFLPREELAEIETEGEFYVADMVGLPVEDDSGNKIGTLAAVENFGAGDLLEIKPFSGESFYIAFTQENVPVIDMDGRKIVITGAAYANR
jgi:16S rRNA processing protein RimM